MHTKWIETKENELQRGQIAIAMDKTLVPPSGSLN